MRRFNVTVNGKAYDVAVEEVNGAAAPVAAAPAPVAAPAPAAAPAAPAPAAAPAAAPAPAAVPADGTKVSAPMPGTILDVKVNVGDSVGQNAVVVVLEAMKMENDIVTPVAGTVASVNVKKGDSVNVGDVLVVVG